VAILLLYILPLELQIAVIENDLGIPEAEAPVVVYPVELTLDVSLVTVFVVEVSKPASVIVLTMVKAIITAITKLAIPKTSPRTNPIGC